jgi:hypothetical protein
MGTEGRISEVTRDPALDPKLSPWSRFWLDDALYAKVKNSLSKFRVGIRQGGPLTRPTGPAASMPGRDTAAFRMPESLFTVNTLISGECHSAAGLWRTPCSSNTSLLQQLLPPDAYPALAVSSKGPPSCPNIMAGELTRATGRLTLPRRHHFSLRGSSALARACRTSPAHDPSPSRWLRLSDAPCRFCSRWTRRT